MVPEVVVYEENSEDATSLDYSRLVPLLIEAIKELGEENQELRARLEALEEAPVADGGAVLPMSSGGLLNPWLLFSGLALAGLVLG